MTVSVHVSQGARTAVGDLVARPVGDLLATRVTTRDSTVVSLTITDATDDVLTPVTATQ